MEVELVFSGTELFLARWVYDKYLLDEEKWFMKTESLSLKSRSNKLKTKRPYGSGYLIY